MLVSGGGDPELKLWDWMSGEHLADIPILQTVKPYLIVQPAKGPTRTSEEEDDEQRTEDGKTGKPQGNARKGRGKGKGKAKAKGGEEGPSDLVEVSTEVIEGAVETSTKEVTDETEIPLTECLEGPESSESQDTSSVLVIRRISSTEVPNGGGFIIFSAVGYAC